MKKSQPWVAGWIARNMALPSWQGKVMPAPLLRTTFQLEEPVAFASVLICGLGYHELYINGKKVGNEVLSPTVTQYEKRVAFVEHVVTEHLRTGENVIGVILGNGWYNSHTPEVWHFDKATWRDYPKLRIQLDAKLVGGDSVRVVSDESWRTHDSPITFDGLRNGEHYDARLEQLGWAEPGFDASDWQAASIVSPPGGILERQVAPPCRVVETLAPATSWFVSPTLRCFDLGQNIAGWARITVTGRSGSELTLRYGERLDGDRRVDQHHIASFIKGGDTQTDRYILKESTGSQSWEPRFTYHGFQFVQVEGPEDILATMEVQGRVVQTNFSHIGNFESSDPQLNRLYQATHWSFRGNFVGLPTDCPHREKNGWLGDAHLAAEFGLMNFDAARAYEQWLLAIADAQRPSGQLPGIVPTAGWGYNWGSGPAWDCAFILIPWYIYLYTGSLSAIETHFEQMKRYMDFCAQMASGHILRFGLGDWCHVDPKRMAPAELTSTAYYHVAATLVSRFAGLLEREEDKESYASLAAEIRDAFNLAFYRGNGVYADGQQTAQACALYQNLVEARETEAVVQRLVESVVGHECRPDFGILGAKYVPRALAEHGHASLAYKLIMQQSYPGWMHWLSLGATTLWEDWHGESSRNHVMFGDVAAWMMQYVAGLAPDPTNPGFRHVIIRPCPVVELDRVWATHQTPHGLIRCGWEREGDAVYAEIELPSDVTATLFTPEGTSWDLSPNDHRIKIV
jgi:alpha-L-rhamnosidase